MSVEGAQLPMMILILAALLAAGVIMTLWRRVKTLAAANASLSMQSLQYETAMQLTQDVVYEWTAADSRLSRASRIAKIFGSAPVYDDFPESLFQQKKIHPDDERKAREAIRELTEGTGRAVSELRLLDTSGRYVWYRNSMTAVRDENGKLVKVLGVIANINEEKLRLQIIEDSAKKDPLTKLLNKAVTEEMVTLQLGPPDARCALFIVDIDNFKSVNDTLGHLYGDAALSEIARALSGIFRDTDVVGRIGGDEFLVCMTNVPGRDIVAAKAGKVLAAVRRSYCKDGVVCEISASIGVSCFPADDKTYAGLVDKADRALYYIKQHGKNSFAFYEDVRGSAQPHDAGAVQRRREIPSGVPQQNFREHIADYMLRIFYEHENTDKAVPVLLDFVGKAFGIGRIDVSVFSEDQSLLQCLYEWRGEGVAAAAAALGVVRAAPWKSVKDSLDDNDMIICEDVQHSEAEYLRHDTLKTRGVASAIFGYSIEGEQRRSVVTFEYFGERHYFSSEEQYAMKVISRTIGLFVVRSREREELLRYMAKERQSKNKQ